MTPNPQDSAVALEVEREAIDQQVRQIYVSQGPRGLMQLCIQLLAEKARASQSDGTSRTPSATWRVNGEPDPHGKRYDCERAALTLGKMTDDELANGAFMNYDAPLNLAGIIAGTHYAPIVWMTGVKDRIRWLSRKLEEAAPSNPKERTMSDDLHSAIMNLQIPMDPKIPSDAGVMLAYKLGHRDARHAAAELALSTPPAVMPAAPSDAVLDDVIQIVRNVYGGVTDGGSEAKARAHRRAQAHRSLTVALSQTMQPQAEPAAGEQAGAPFGIIDPDYARYYTLIRTTAWQCGYAIGLHGSFTRDLDLIAAPWTCQAVPPDLLIKQIEYRTDLRRQEPEGQAKPHGRLCWSLLLPGSTDPRWIDLSVIPTLAAPSAAIAAREQEAEAFLRQMASLPGTIIRSSRDLSPQAISNARASSKWLALRDGLGFAIMAEHARQAAEDEQSACAKCSSPDDCRRLGCAATALSGAARGAAPYPMIPPNYLHKDGLLWELVGDHQRAVTALERDYSARMLDRHIENMMRAYVDADRAALTQPTTVQQAEPVDPVGKPLNDASWAFVNALPEGAHLNGHLWNNLKPTLKVAIETYLAAINGMQPGERKEGV